MIQIQLQQHDPRAVLESENPRRGEGFQPFGDDGLTFADVIDIINPLQHIPVVGSFYRKLTGDAIDPAIRIAGGALFGGPLGAIASTMAVAVNAAIRTPVDASPETETQVAEQGSQAPAAPLPPPAPDGRSPSVQTSNRPAAQPPADAAQQISAITSRQPRRGGWMIAQAYGETLTRFAEVAPGKSHHRINETV